MENIAVEDNTQPPVPDSARLGIEGRDAFRQQCLAWRQALPAAVYQRWSAQLVENLLGWLTAQQLPSDKTVAFCWPVQNEPDVLPLIQCWQAQGLRVALPVVLASAQPLIFRQWQQGEPLQADRYGIPTPVTGEIVQPDILLLPGNAFDHRGFRLGYGGGFFDRTLADMNPRPLVIGLGFSAVLVTDLCPAPHDIPVDVLITEKSSNTLR